jgi:hypothetical protein
MVSLLSLPLEIREYIIQYAVTSSAPIIDASNPGETKEYHDLDYTSRIGGNGLRYPDRKHQTSPCGLLCANRQLYDETRHTLQRLHAAKGNKYALNLLVASEDIFYPSYTDVPPPTRDVDELAITVGIFGASANPLSTNGFMDKGGSTGPAVWRLYSVLERFFRCGAAEARAKDEDRKLKVNTVDINIETPTHECTLAPEDISLDRLPEYRREHEPHDQLMHPEALAKFMFVWVEGILRMCDPRYAVPGSPIAKYGKMFLERIRKMKIRVDGDEKLVIDVVEWEREIKWREEQERIREGEEQERQRRYREGQERAIREREERERKLRVREEQERILREIEGQRTELEGIEEEGEESETNAGEEYTGEIKVQPSVPGEQPFAPEVPPSEAEEQSGLISASTDSVLD